MLKYKLLKPKIKPNQQGFTMLEVLLAIVMAAAFVAASMQALVLAMAFKVGAQEEQRANQLIQGDIERVLLLASNLAQVNSKCYPASFNDGYANALWNGNGTPENAVQSYSSASSSNLPPTKQLLGDEGTVLGLRRTSFTSTYPFKVLKIKYEVREWDGTNFNMTDDPIAEDYIEVIPNAAFFCP